MDRNQELRDINLRISKGTATQADRARRIQLVKADPAGSRMGTQVQAPVARPQPPSRPATPPVVRRAPAPTSGGAMARPKQMTSAKGKPAPLPALPKATGPGKSNDREAAIWRITEAMKPQQVSELDWLDNQLRTQPTFGNTKVPFDVSYGIPHTKAGEGIWEAALESSGRPTSSLFNEALEQFGASDWQESTTDLAAFIGKDRRLVDIQNSYGTDFNLGILKGGNKYKNAAAQAWDSASDDDTLQSIIEKAYRGDKTFKRSKFGMTQQGYWSPMPLTANSRVKNQGQYYEQDLILGGRYDGRGPLNQSEGELVKRKILTSDEAAKTIRKRGPYNPTMPDKAYAYDLTAARNSFMPMTKGQLKGLQSYGKSPILTSRNSMTLSLPFDAMKEYSRGTETMDALISKDVKAAMRRFNPGMEFNASFLPTNTGPKLNLQSAQRMAGKKLVKSGLAADVAITGGLSYLTGESDNAAEAAWAGATSLIPDSGGTADTIEIDGKVYSRDQSTNMITPLGGGKTQGLAYKDGKPVAVPYGSLKGRTSMVDDVVTPIKAIGKSIVDTHQRREAERKPIPTAGKSRYSQGVKPVRPATGDGKAWWQQATDAVMGVFGK